MKNLQYVLLLIIITSAAFVYADNVPEETALQKAILFFGGERRQTSIERCSFTGVAEMYKVATDNGWILLSTETSIKPVLAYSRTSDFPDINNMPEGMKWLFSYYENAIAYAKQHQYELRHINAWADEVNGLNRTSDSVYLALLGEIAWGQSGNNSLTPCEKAYNKFCPDFHSVYCGRTIVGCGAVALGQVLWYYKWPYVGWIPKYMLNDQGSVSSEMEYRHYDWNLMPSRIFSSTDMLMVDMTTSFLRDCGYAEHMEYGTSSSTTYVNLIRNALINNFDYTAESWNRSLASFNWVDRMKNELRAGRPVIYRGGNNSGGHFFILYGFDGDWFNINWGWNGNYNDVMCTLDSIYYAPNSHYNEGQWAIINITPNYPSCSPVTIPSADVWSNNFLIQNGGGIVIGNRTISYGMTGNILSGEYVLLNGGFGIETGAEVIIDIKDMHCDDPDMHVVPMKQPHLVNFPEPTLRPAQKLLRDNQLLILRGDKMYTISGQEVK